jgi:hypothetical protein
VWADNGDTEPRPDSAGSVEYWFRTPTVRRGTVRYVSIFKLAPGTDNARKALEVYAKLGVPAGTEASWAAVDGKTFISIIETDTPDMVITAAYAPFFEEVTVIPVVALDAAWLEATQQAQSNWG